VKCCIVASTCEQKVWIVTSSISTKRTTGTHFCDSIGSFWVEANLCNYLFTTSSHVESFIYCLFITVLSLDIHLSRGQKLGLHQTLTSP
jgi:hypothetical protein